MYGMRCQPECETKWGLIKVPRRNLLDRLVGEVLVPSSILKMVVVEGSLYWDGGGGQLGGAEQLSDQ